MKIALVDDNPVNQKSFQQKIAPYSDVELVFISNSGDDFMERMKGLPVINWPQVVFMDIQMPGLNGIDTIKLAKAIYTPILKPSGRAHQAICLSMKIFTL